MNRTALLAVSFGTAYEETRKKTLDAIEADLRAAFPERAFYRAWTSGTIRRKLALEKGIQIDSASEAVDRMLGDGVTDLLVQPTHMMAGGEYEALRQAIGAHARRFDTLRMGEPLLADVESLSDLADAILSTYAELRDDELLALMGHGSADSRFAAYELLDERFRASGHANICVGTVEHEPGIAPVLARVNARRPRKVTIAPLLVVAGGHAIRDMAGDGPESWKSQIGATGVQTECVLKGMGEYAAVRALYVKHARRAKQIQAEAVNDAT
ncbi:MAG: sirohydrochlorin cobaltochelatase [Clostridia bacterium]|nr:sirohydrochlorin cobaltochelatase [Clostridia bacterium]